MSKQPIVTRVADRTLTGGAFDNVHHFKRWDCTPGELTVRFTERGMVEFWRPDDRTRPAHIRFIVGGRLHGYDVDQAGLLVRRRVDPPGHAAAAGGTEREGGVMAMRAQCRVCGIVWQWGHFDLTLRACKCPQCGGRCGLVRAGSQIGAVRTTADAMTRHVVLPSRRTM